jgi:hypothetical protein
VFIYLMAYGNIYTKTLAGNGSPKTPEDKKPASALGMKRVFLLRQTSEDVFLVVIGGLEPPTPAL